MTRYRKIEYFEGQLTFYEEPGEGCIVGIHGPDWDVEAESLEQLQAWNYEQECPGCLTLNGDDASPCGVCYGVGWIPVQDDSTT